MLGSGARDSMRSCPSGPEMRLLSSQGHVVRETKLSKVLEKPVSLASLAAVTASKSQTSTFSHRQRVTVTLGHSDQEAPGGPGALVCVLCCVTLCPFLYGNLCLSESHSISEWTVRSQRCVV